MSENSNDSDVENELNEDSDEEKEFSELLDEYQNQEKMWHFEGDSGVAKLNKLVEAIGYEKHQFLYGSPLEVFLSDNPGACEALLEWIRENGETGIGSDENSWRDNLISNLKEKESDDELDNDEE